MLKYPLWKGFIFYFYLYFLFYLSIDLFIDLLIYLFIYFFFGGEGSLGRNIVKHADRRNLCRVIV